MAVALLLLLAACDAGSGEPRAGGTPVPSPTRADTSVIGLVTTLRGRDAYRGEDAFEGADLAVHELNRSLERDERRFELVTLDDKGDPAEAARLVQELAASPRTVGVVFGGPTEGLPPAAGALAVAGVPGILCYGDLYSAQLLRPPLFQTSPPLIWQARRIASYLLRDRRYDRVGALVSSSLDGSTAADVLGIAVEERRGRPGPTVAYDDLEDLRPALDRLRKRRVEALVIEGGPRAIHAVATELREMGASYRSTSVARIASAPRRVRGRRQRSGHWRPQLVGFDLAVAARRTDGLPPGTIAAETYARGVHYLPIPSFESFTGKFANWWGESRPLGWELRAYEATRMIGWAARQRRGEESVISSLERLRNRRFGGLDITLGPDDHTSVEQTTVGLWAVPKPGLVLPAEEREFFERLPWVPLARGFSIDGRRTVIQAEDWRHLFRNPPPPRAPAPRFTRMRFGISTTRSDPIH